MRCKYCGAHIKKDAYVCPSCGNLIDENIDELREQAFSVQEVKSGIREKFSDPALRKSQKYVPVEGGCPYCGAVLPKGSVFCKSCGNLVSDAAHLKDLASVPSGVFAANSEFLSGGNEDSALSDEDVSLSDSCSEELHAVESQNVNLVTEISAETFTAAEISNEISEKEESAGTIIESTNPVSSSPSFDSSKYSATALLASLGISTAVSVAANSGSEEPSPESADEDVTVSEPIPAVVTSIPESSADELPVCEPASGEVPVTESIADELPVSEFVASENVPISEPVPDEIAVPELVSDDVPVSEPVADAVSVSEPLPAVVVFIPESSVDEVPVCEPALDEVPVSESVVSKDVPISEPVPAVVFPISESSADEVPVSEPALDEVPVSEPALDEVPVSEPIADEVPVSEPDLDEIPVSEPIADEIPVSEPIADEVPVSEPIAEEVPISEPIAEEVPVSEPIAEEVPVCEPIAEEVPVREPVSDEVAVSEPVTEAPPHPASSPEKAATPVIAYQVREPGTIRCTDCGRWFKPELIRRCKKCGAIVCPDCRPTHKQRCIPK